MLSHHPRVRPQTHALLVMNQTVLADAVRRSLDEQQYRTQVASTYAEADSALTDWAHLVLLDLDIAVAALAFLERVAAPTRRDERLPLIALTRRRDLKTKLAAFEGGVDDILTIPFAGEELGARVAAVMRRAYSTPAAFMRVLRFGDLEIDLLNRRVRAGNIPVRLTGLEQSLLYVLAANAGRLVTRDEILDCLWGPDYVAESNVVDRHIRNLRVKLQHPQRRQCIVTVPGRGYRFVSPAATR